MIEGGTMMTSCFNQCMYFFSGSHIILVIDDK